MQKLYYIFVSALYRIFDLFPIQKNKVVISSYFGLGYGDNGKYIVEELLKRKNKYDIVWLAKSGDCLFPAGVRYVPFKSLRSIYEQCTAKIWIDNRRKRGYVVKRKKQIYINTWHGYMGIKKLEKDAEAKLSRSYVNEAKHDSQMVDYFVSGSRWETNCIRKSFWYDGTILECGYPRSDILFHGRNVPDVKAKLGLKPDDKILLYAPTFRKSLDKESFAVYAMDWEKVLSALTQKFGGHWVGMIRLHPNLSAISGMINIPSDIVNASSYDDMQELIASCDCLITDYSSTIMDAGVANKIGFIYATDYEAYQQDRDVYFDIKKDLPFPFSENTAQLLNNIDLFDGQQYQKKLNDFFDVTYGVYRNESASGYICDLIDKSIRP